MQRKTSTLLVLLFSWSALAPKDVQDAVAHLPGLVEHYLQHKAENPDITVAEFWELHYGIGYSQHNTDHDHSKLPGKATCCHQHAGMQPAIVDDNSVARVIVFEASSKLVQAPGFNLSGTYIDEIWQPPKTC